MRDLLTWRNRSVDPSYFSSFLNVFSSATMVPTCSERSVARCAELVPEAHHHGQHAQAHHYHQVDHLIHHSCRPSYHTWHNDDVHNVWRLRKLEYIKEYSPPPPREGRNIATWGRKWNKQRRTKINYSWVEMEREELLKKFTNKYRPL